MGKGGNSVGAAGGALGLGTAGDCASAGPHSWVGMGCASRRDARSAGVANATAVANSRKGRELLDGSANPMR